MNQKNNLSNLSTTKSHKKFLSTIKTNCVQYTQTLYKGSSTSINHKNTFHDEKNLSTTKYHNKFLSTIKTNTLSKISKINCKGFSGTPIFIDDKNYTSPEFGFEKKACNFMFFFKLKKTIDFVVYKSVYTVV